MIFSLDFRISETKEITGLDLLEHDLESSYPDFEFKKPIITN